MRHSYAHAQYIHSLPIVYHCVCGSYRRSLALAVQCERTCPQASVAERERRMICHGVAQKSITYSVEYGMNGYIYSANLLLWTDGDDVMGTDIV